MSSDNNLEHFTDRYVSSGILYIKRYQEIEFDIYDPSDQQ